MALVIVAATMISSHTRMESDHLAIHARHFTLSIDLNSCNASLLVGGNRSSTPQPLLLLYNKVSDGLLQNMDACVHASLVDTGSPSSTTTLLRVSSAHGYGSIMLSITTNDTFVTLTMHELKNWHADPHEKHVAFGEWWVGLLDNSTAPIVMGELQGPHALPGVSAVNGAPSAGFMTVSERSYYRYIFYAEEGDAVAFTFCPTPVLAKVLEAAKPPSVGPNPTRSLSWLWSGLDFSEATLHKYADLAVQVGADMLMASGWDNVLSVDRTKLPHGLNHTVSYLNSRGLRLGLHMHPDIVYPCENGTGIECLESGIGISPIVLDCPECLVPDGLAPTYRSGQSYSIPNRTIFTEDLGFWWCHERSGALCRNGPPAPCSQGHCNSHDWSTPWGANMTLHGGFHWSTLGTYRDGGAAGFDGMSHSFGEVVLNNEMRDGLAGRHAGLTIGMVAHLSSASGCLASLPGLFFLCFVPETALLSWNISTSSGERTALSSTPLLSGKTYVIRATFNSTNGGVPRIFINGKLDSHMRPSAEHGAEKTSVLASVREGASIRFGSGFHGALEELFLKNVSTENRHGYLFADDNRISGTYLLDLTQEAGRNKFAQLIVDVLRQAPIAAVQYDGFEKLNLLAGRDFAHSNRTFTSGLYRGNAPPDWYHYEGWPLYVGLGVSQGVLRVRERTVALSPYPPPATELSLFNPGNGPWKQDMVPYTDEHYVSDSQHDLPLVSLGLQWHSKILQRIELTGTLVNAYNTDLTQVTSQFELDYWFGGLVTGGIAPQPRFRFSGLPVPEPLPFTGVADATKVWLDRYRRWGHAVEGSVHTLVYDPQCCHVQGICEWVACNDTVFARLAGGSAGVDVPKAGLVVGSSLHATLPPHLFDTSRAVLLLFQTAHITSTSLTIGAPTDLCLTIIFTSPVQNSSLALSAGFFNFTTPHRAYQTISTADGTQVSRKPLFNGQAVLGSHRYILDRSDLAHLATGFEVMFEKIAADGRSEKNACAKSIQ